MLWLWVVSGIKIKYSNAFASVCISKLVSLNSVTSVSNETRQFVLLCAL